MSATYQQKQQEIRDFCMEQLQEIAEYEGAEDFKDMCTSDLHHQIFNTNYYIVGRYPAKVWMGVDAFDFIAAVQEYEDMHFGESYTDLSDPENVANMWAYVQGYEIIDECYEEVCDSLTNQCELDIG